MIGKKLMAAGAVALAILSVGGAAIAAGKGSDATRTPATVQSSSGDTDTLEVEAGDQNEADDPDEPNEAEEANEAEEPGDENLPGGGHADAEGQDVNHEFEGVE